MSIWKTKPLSVLLNEASEDEKGLKELYQQDLWFLGVGAIIELDCSH
jgi:APA family basic amino acid/polyamine antiporter